MIILYKYIFIIYNNKMEDIKEDNNSIKGEKELKLNDKIDKRQSIPLTKNSIFVQNPKSSIAANYFMNVKKNKLKKPPMRHSFMKEPDKKNQISTMKQDKISLNKTLEVNNYKNSIKNNNIANNNKTKFMKNNSLCLNPRNDNNTTISQKNNLVRKSMILINKNKDNKSNKIQDKRTSLILQKNKNYLRLNKDKTNNILEKIVEKNEDKKNDVNNEQEIKNKNDYKRAYSRKPTERERQKKLNKLNKNSFGAVAKYTKKTAPYLKRERDKKENIKNNIMNKPANKIQRTKTNYNLITKGNKIINNINKNKNNVKNIDWSNRNLPELKKVNNKLINNNKNFSNLYDKYKNKKEKENNTLKDKTNKIRDWKDNPMFRTIGFKSVLLNNKSNIKPKNKNINKKFELNNKNKKINNHTGSMILPPPKKDLNRRKSAISLRNKNSKISKKIIQKNDNKKEINNINIKKVNKSFIEKENEKEKDKENKEKEKEKEEEKEKGKDDINDSISENKSDDSDKKALNINQKKDKEESDSEEDEDDEGDFDIYAMIRSKSCNRRTKKDNKNSDSENSDNSEESEAKSFSSEEECDIESILYPKEKRRIFKNIEEDNNNNNIESIVRCIDYDGVFLTSNNMFTENIQKNNLYNKYFQKFDEIFDKFILKFKDNKKIFDKRNKINKEDDNNEKENHILNQSEVTEDDSSNKNCNS